jgi:hypothetical protein
MHGGGHQQASVFAANFAVIDCIVVVQLLPYGNNQRKEASRQFIPR